MRKEQKTILVDLDNLESIEKAEVRKANLENMGYNMIMADCGFSTARLTYELD